MDLPIAVLIGSLLALILVRQLALRRVAARQGQFIWLALGPTFLIGFAMLWISLTTLPRQPLIGLAIGIIGVVYVVGLARAASQMSSAITATRPEDDLSGAIVDPLTEFMLANIGVVLVGGLVAVVALIVWAIALR
jgi:hypothetical protein